MQYTNGLISDVKSVSQQAMCRYWALAAADQRYPSLDLFRPNPGLHDPKQLNIWNVERGDHELAFRALYQGQYVSEVFNSSWAGKLMQDVLPPPLKSIGVEAATECATSGCAIYSVFSTYNSRGDTIDCERLLLPLGRGEYVEQIVASLQLLSRAGSFNRDTVIRHFEWKTEISCAMRIAASTAELTHR
jgi:hypothetical protein